MSDKFTPHGTRFYSQSLHRFCILVSDGSFKGWICYRVADGNWVSLRKATEKDLADLKAAKELMPHNLPHVAMAILDNHPMYEFTKDE